MGFFSTRAKVGGGVAAAMAVAVPLVAGFEGYAAKPYVDRIGTGQPLTWCYGETKADGPEPPLNAVFTKAECTEQLQKKLTEVYDPGIRACIHVPMPPKREAAMVSAAYNLGVATVCRSAMAKYLNAGNVQAACDALLAYDHAGGREIPGLLRRRQAERQLCLSDN